MNDCACVTVYIREMIPNSIAISNAQRRIGIEKYHRIFLKQKNIIQKIIIEDITIACVLLKFNCIKLLIKVEIIQKIIKYILLFGFLYSTNCETVNMTIPTSTKLTNNENKSILNPPDLLL